MPTEEETYRKGVLEKLDDLKTAVGKVDTKVDTVDTKVSYTNGKVRKITIALVLLGGIVIGQSFSNSHDLITLFAHLAV